MTMLEDAHAELYRQLVQVSNEAPMPVVANCIEVMATVLNNRLHREMGEFVGEYAEATPSE